MKNLFRAVGGLILLFVVHLPRVIYRGLLASYAAVFHKGATLTANPSEHIKRAKRILRKGDLSRVLYAALELRFAVERMAQADLIFAESASNRMIAEPCPVKKISNMRRLAPSSGVAHDFFLINATTGERVKIDGYTPLDRVRVAEIKGRLGDLLHPKEGIPLGMRGCSWYAETGEFLESSLNYLESVLKDSTQFFTYEGLDHIEMVERA